VGRVPYSSLISGALRDARGLPRRESVSPVVVTEDRASPVRSRSPS